MLVVVVDQKELRANLQQQPPLPTSHLSPPTSNLPSSINQPRLPIVVTFLFLFPSVFPLSSLPSLLRDPSNSPEKTSSHCPVANPQPIPPNDHLTCSDHEPTSTLHCHQPHLSSILIALHHSHLTSLENQHLRCTVATASRVELWYVQRQPFNSTSTSPKSLAHPGTQPSTYPFTSHE